MFSGLRYVSSKLFRTKTVSDEFLDSQLRRCLSTWDITLLGIGHMIGAGIYVLTGAVAKNIAGPGIILSFILAGVASLLSALCYAEFGARVPKAGSAYTYTYVTMGELWAFVIGWNIILEHMLGAAAVARSWSGYLDSLLGHVVRNGTIDYVGGIESDILGDYPDFIAFFVVIIVCFFMGYGAKASTNFNSIFTIINGFVIAFVCVFGFSFANGRNWSDYGGFVPYGFNGVLAGAASCFFAFIGFDGIATSGEEASNPSKSIPRATILSMTVVTVSYVLMSSALTLMVPYTKIHSTAAFADAFEQNGVMWAKYIVAVGALSGMTTSLVGSLFALPRCVYAMANDGLIFKWLAHVHGNTQVPTLATAVFGGVTAMIALLFDVETLVQFLSIGTLMAYTIVSCSVIILRYQHSPISYPERDMAHELGFESNAEGNVVVDSADPEEDDTNLLSLETGGMGGTLKARYSFLEPYLGQGRFDPGVVVCGAIVVMCIAMFCIAALISYGRSTISTGGIIGSCCFFGIFVVGSIFVMYMHRQDTGQLRFKVPLVPLIPSISIMINIIFMMHLSWRTWVRLAIWLAVGFLVYFFYGVKNSVENRVMTKEYSNLMGMSNKQTSEDTINVGGIEPKESYSEIEKE